jgi:hypothetical protein
MDPKHLTPSRRRRRGVERGLDAREAQGGGQVDEGLESRECQLKPHTFGCYERAEKGAGRCRTLASCCVLGRQITVIRRTIMSTDTDKTAIRAVVTAIHKALRDRDASAVTAHYVSDAAGRPPPEPPALRGPGRPGPHVRWIGASRRPAFRSPRSVALRPRRAWRASSLASFFSPVLRAGRGLVQVSSAAPAGSSAEAFRHRRATQGPPEPEAFTPASSQARCQELTTGQRATVLRHGADAAQCGGPPDGLVRGPRYTRRRCITLPRGYSGGELRHDDRRVTF